MQHARRAAVITLVVAAAVHTARGTLLAHAMLVAAEPAAESVVVSPSRIRLLFSEEIEPSLASISLVASDRRVTKLPVRGDPHDVDALIGAVSQLPRGAYRVQWHVVSADGHPVGGSFVFWVGDKNMSAGTPVAADDTTLDTVWGPAIARAPLIPAILRGAAVGAAMSLAGLLLFFIGVRGDDMSAASRAEPTTRWLVIATPLLLVASAAAWAANASPSHRLTSSDILAVFASGVGRLELWRVGLALL
ncbi:MAG TPA: copper resistance CopC family protein, partial [Gemmatimonadaceae bacterium]|nr:copper resistance CopC family protein [Gemmatimonadaceae bacterium]